MNDIHKKPKLTFVIVAYNQAQTIEEAISGALRQTYSPLEIVISDDCSLDETFYLMQKAVGRYHGPHEIVLNRNQKNLGIVKHVDKVMEISNGEFIVINSGDDISHPERAEKIAERWLTDQGNIMLIHSPVERIDSEGNKLGRYESQKEVIEDPSILTIGKNGGVILGASMAWNRKVFDEFGPLGDGIDVEDAIIAFRASILGKIEYIDEVLLNWRTGGTSTKLQDRGPTYEYMYGRFHKLRKWKSQTDYYILHRFTDVEYPWKREVELACKQRYEELNFQVRLAESGCVIRLFYIYEALIITLRYKHGSALKQWMQYALEPIYLIYVKFRKKN